MPSFRMPANCSICPVEWAFWSAAWPGRAACSHVQDRGGGCRHAAPARCGGGRVAEAVPRTWGTGCFSGPSRGVWGGRIWCRCRCRLWRRWLYTHPARCSEPGVVFGPYRVVCGARGVSGWVSPACFCFLVPVFASLVSTHSVRLTLLLFYSVFRVLAVCCCASSCAAAGDDSPRSCHKCF